MIKSIINHKYVMKTVGTRFQLTQSWAVRPWPKKSHTMNFVEYGLKNSVPVGSIGSLHVLSGCRNVNHENVSESRSSIHGQAFIQWLLSFFSFHSLLSPFFSVPLSRGLLHIIQALSYHLGPTLVDHPNTHLSICPIRRPYQFFVSCSDQGNTVQGSSPH